MRLKFLFAGGMFSHKIKLRCIPGVVAVALLANPVQAYAGYKEVFVELMNQHYGGICEVKQEGLFKNTMRVDWKSETVMLHVIKVMGEVGEAKEDLYKDGIRYFKFPNDMGGYNIIDWKTGEKKSVSERAPYYFDS
jgi:hypothetical protein